MKFSPNVIRIASVAAILGLYAVMTAVVEAMEESRDPSITRLPSFKFANWRRDEMIEEEFTPEEATDGSR